jgi:NAD(P)H-nitrite reductase large subunit
MEKGRLTAMTIRDFVIVGAGSAGRSAAEYLSERAQGRSILLVDDEGVLPYKRTQVSKFIDQGYGLEDFRIHDSSWYSDNGIELRTGEAANRIDTQEHKLELDTGAIGYRRLLLATGAVPVNPFGGPGSRLLTNLWTVRDGIRLHKVLPGCDEVAIIGNGVLGVEAAWQCVRMGLRVTLYGRRILPMPRYLDEKCSSILLDSIRKAGVVCRTGFSVNNVTEGPEGVILDTDDGHYTADFAIITSGSRPGTAVAERSGIACGKGILVDLLLRTSAPDVWAAGECAEHPDGSVTGLWHSAEHQGRIAAENMLGGNARNDNPPFRLKCEVFGGFWFSAGPVGLDAETWDFGNVLWRVSFQSGLLKALQGAAPGGLDKNTAKSAQELVMKSAGRDEVYSVLSSDVP